MRSNPKLRAGQLVLATPMSPDELGDVRGECVHDMTGMVEVFAVRATNGKLVHCLYPPKDFAGECEVMKLGPQVTKEEAIEKAKALLESMPKMDKFPIYWIDEANGVSFTVADLKALVRDGAVETIKGTL